MMKRILSAILAIALLFSFAACSKDKEETSLSELEAYVEEHGDVLTSTMEASFSQGADGLMDCECSIEVEGTKLVLSCNIIGLDNVPDEAKQQMQEAYDSMDDTFKQAFAEAKEEVPSLSQVDILVCEEDGDVLATIVVEL